MTLDRNRVWDNDTIWWARKSRAMTIQDSNNNTDKLGYTVSLFPDC